MIGRELIEAIKRYHMEETQIDADTDCTVDGLIFKLAEVRSPADEDDVRYIDFAIDLHDGSGKLLSW